MGAGRGARGGTGEGSWSRLAGGRSPPRPRGGRYRRASHREYQPCLQEMRPVLLSLSGLILWHCTHACGDVVLTREATQGRRAHGEDDAQVPSAVCKEQQQHGRPPAHGQSRPCGERRGVVCPQSGDGSLCTASDQYKEGCWQTDRCGRSQRGHWGLRGSSYSLVELTVVAIVIKNNIKVVKVEPWSCRELPVLGLQPRFATPTAGDVDRRLWSIPEIEVLYKVFCLPKSTYLTTSNQSLFWEPFSRLGR